RDALRTLELIGPFAAHPGGELLPAHPGRWVEGHAARWSATAARIVEHHELGPVLGSQAGRALLELVAALLVVLLGLPEAHADGLGAGAADLLAAFLVFVGLTFRARWVALLLQA